jgi:hypothetical protein
MLVARVMVLSMQVNIGAMSINVIEIERINKFLLSVNVAFTANAFGFFPVELSTLNN